MKFRAGVLVGVLATLAAVSTVEAKDSKPVGKLGPRQYNTINWGRRSDLTLRLQSSVRVNPFVKIS
jgi:hypothetical protein